MQKILPRFYRQTEQLSMTSADDELILPCTEKMTFDTKVQAEGVGVTAQWQHGTKLKVYKCVHCELWHLASN
jgi:hypothetical protein